jgi:hypothetical protein
MAVNNIDVIMPKVSLVRNQGWDDSGIHCPTTNIDLVKKHMNQVISEETLFEYIGDGFEYYKTNNQIYVKSYAYPTVSYLKVVKAILGFIVRRLIYGCFNYHSKQ